MLEDKIEQLEHTRDLYLRDLEPENLAIIRKSFGLQVMCKRRDWLKKQVKRCDEEIGGLREQERFND
nr:MAG TPA: hypothetical protein [Caudoviricetes sp.]